MKLDQEAAIECIFERDDDLHVRVRVKAGARADGLLDIRDGRVLLQVKAPAKEGKANRSVSVLLAGVLSVQKNRAVVAHGKRSRDKTVRITSFSKKRAAELICRQL